MPHHSDGRERPTAHNARADEAFVPMPHTRLHVGVRHAGVRVAHRRHAGHGAAVAGLLPQLAHRRSRRVLPGIHETRRQLQRN